MHVFYCGYFPAAALLCLKMMSVTPFKFGEYNSNQSALAIHKPGGAFSFFTISKYFSFSFFLWPIKLLLHGVKKKNETESKYPQIVSPG